MEVNDFTIIEIRIIQNLWTKKTAQYIANLLERSYAEVNRKIQQMNLVHKVKLYQPPLIERRISNREKEWAVKQLAEKKPMKIKDTSALVSVRLDAKTIVMVKPGTDIEALKRRLDANKVKFKR